MSAVSRKSSTKNLNTKPSAIEQFTTFYVGADLFGIEVLKVQEVTGKPNVVPVPLAPEFVHGLINLRGQIATALGLTELFGCPASVDSQQMSVVCKIEGNLVSFVVDSIGEVVEVDQADFEPPPDIVPQNVRQFIKGVYKMNGVLLSVLDLERLAKELSPSVESTNQNRT